MAEERGSCHRREEKERPAFGPLTSQRESKPEVSQMPEGVDSSERICGFQALACEVDSEERHATGRRPTFVFRIHSENFVGQSTRKADFLFQRVLGEERSRLFSLNFAERAPLHDNVHEPLCRIEAMLRSVRDEISEGWSPLQARKARIRAVEPLASQDRFDASLLAEKTLVKFDPARLGPD